MNFKSYNRVIEEGGAFGHMANVHEDWALQFVDLQNIIKSSLTGGVSKEVKEKTDGQALAVSYRSGRVIFARNKGHYRDQGLKSIKGANGVLKFFENHPDNIKDAFRLAAKDLEKAILEMSKPQLKMLFGDGRRWINLEVIFPATVNVIPYNHNLLVAHGFREYDNDGNVVDGDFDEWGRRFAGILQQINQHVQDTYTITSMPMLKIPKVRNFAERQGEMLGELNNIMSQYQLTEDSTVGDYWVAYMSQYISSSARQFNYIVQSDVLTQISYRWAFKLSPPSKRPRDWNKLALDKITSLKNMVDNSEFVQWVSATERSGELKEIYSTMIEPLKSLFLKVGVEVNKNVANFLTLNPDAAVQDIRSEIEKVTAEIEKTGDMDLMKKLEKELKMIERLGGLQSIVPSEGLVFTYTPKGEKEPKIFKFTGSFAPVNQILGSLKFQR